MDVVKFVKVEDDGLVAEVASLARAIWQEHYLPIIGAAQVAYMLDQFQSSEAITAQIQDGYMYYLIGENENHYIGYLSVRVSGEGLFLSKIYLKSDCRGKGFGRQALHFIDSLARENSCPKVWLTVNKKNSDSIKVYQRGGFKIAGPVLQDIGNGFVMDDYQMEKVL